MNRSPKLAVVGAQCVGCGCCEKVCPKHAVRITGGVIAHVDADACVGCGKCAAVCPAAVIDILLREATA